MTNNSRAKNRSTLASEKGQGSRKLSNLDRDGVFYLVKVVWRQKAAACVPILRSAYENKRI